MITPKTGQAELGAAVLKGRFLLGFPEGLASFGSVVATAEGDVGEVVAWLSPQTGGPMPDHPYYAAAKAVEAQRLAVVYVLSERDRDGYRNLWPRTRFSYVPEDKVTSVGPQMPQPGFATFLAIQVIGGTMHGLNAAFLDLLAAESHARPN